MPKSNLIAGHEVGDVGTLTPPRPPNVPLSGASASSPRLRVRGGIVRTQPIGALGTPNAILKPRQPHSARNAAGSNALPPGVAAALLRSPTSPPLAMSPQLAPLSGDTTRRSSFRLSIPRLNSAVLEALGSVFPVPPGGLLVERETAEEREERINDVLETMPRGTSGVVIPATEIGVPQWTVALMDAVPPLKQRLPSISSSDAAASSGATPAEDFDHAAIALHNNLSFQSSGPFAIPAGGASAGAGAGGRQSDTRRNTFMSATSIIEVPGARTSRVASISPLYSIAHQFDADDAGHASAQQRSISPQLPSLPMAMSTTLPPNATVPSMTAGGVGAVGSSPAIPLALQQHHSQDRRRFSIGAGTATSMSGANSPESSSLDDLENQQQQQQLVWSEASAVQSKLLNTRVANLLADVAKAPHLVSLTIHHGDITKAHVTWLAAAIAEPKRVPLQRLALTNCNLDDMTLEPLTEELFHLRDGHPLRTNLHTLDFAHNRLTTLALRQLQLAINNVPAMASLTLKHNPIGKEHTAALVSIMQHCQTLEHLDIGFCGLGDHTLVQVAHLLHEKLPLLRLSLDAAHISQAVAVMLLEGAETNGNLVELSLQYMLFCSTNTYKRRINRALQKNANRLLRAGAWSPTTASLQLVPGNVAQKRDAMVKRLAGFAPFSAGSGVLPPDAPFRVYPHPCLTDISERLQLESAYLSYAKSSKLSTLGVSTVNLLDLRLKGATLSDVRAARDAIKAGGAMATGDGSASPGQVSLGGSDSGSDDRNHDSSDDEDPLIDWNGWERLGLKKGYRVYTSNAPTIDHRRGKRRGGAGKRR